RAEAARSGVSGIARRQRPERVSLGSDAQITENWLPLLDVLHRQQRAVVAAAGVHGARHDGGERVSHLGILGCESLDDGHVALVGLVGIRNIGSLILYDQIQIVAHDFWKDRDEL